MTGFEFKKLIESNNELFTNRMPCFVIAPDHANINSQYLSYNVNYISLTIVKSEYYKDYYGNSDILINITHRISPYNGIVGVTHLLSKLTSRSLIEELGRGFKSYYKVIELDREFSTRTKNEVFTQLNKYRDWRQSLLRESNLSELISDVV